MLARRPLAARRLPPCGCRPRRLSTASQAMQLLARGAEAVLRRQDAHEVEATLDEAAGALAEVDAPPWALWPLHSARGALAQSRGQLVAAHAELEQALALATQGSEAGVGDDAFQDLAGCLIDLSACELQLRTDSAAQTAAQRARRAKFMASRAHKPASELLRRVDEVLALTQMGEDGGDAVRVVLLQAQEGEYAGVEGRCRCTLAALALGEAHAAEEIQKRDSLLGKAARGAERALPMLGGAEAAAASAILADATAGIARTEALQAGVAAAALALPGTHFARVMLSQAARQQDARDESCDLAAAEAAAELAPLIGEAHPVVMQLRRAAAGGRAIVPGLCSAIPTPTTTALRLWFWAGGEMDDEE